MPDPAPSLADLRHALDQSTIVATTDVAGTITFANEKFCEISKYPRREIIGQNHRILNSGHHPAEFFQTMYREIANGRVWRGEIRNRAKDGSLYWVDTTVVPFLNESGKPYQYMAIRYDISERKRAEALVLEQSALSRLGQMAAVVAHEVRNPLAGIRGALQVVGSRLPPGDASRPIIAEGIARIDSLDDLVQDLLTFGRPTPAAMTRLAVSSLIREKIALLASDPRFAGVTFRVELDEADIAADRGQIRQVLLNLLINSAQAMNGSGEIAVAVRREGGWCQVTIADQGPGIAPHLRQRLFEPFFTTKHRGTGLGLATARRIVERHSGTLTLDCPSEGGTIATIRLPVVSSITGV